MKHTPPTRIWPAVVFMVILMITASRLFAQHTSSARATGLGAFTALGGGLSGLDYNPAALTQLGRWQMSGVSSMTWNREWNAPFIAAVVGRSFELRHGAAVRYSPGLVLDFSVPSSVTIQGPLNTFRTTFDKKLSYAEVYSAGYGYRFSDVFSAGIAGHAYEERVTDTKYTRDSSGAIRSSTDESVATTLTLDAGILWSPAMSLQFGLSGRNLARGLESRLPDDLGIYAVAKEPLYTAGAAYTGFARWTFAADFDSRREFRTGAEWEFLPGLRLRSGLYIDPSTPLLVDALGFGAGVSMGRVAFDAGALVLTGAGNRSSASTVSLLDQLSLNNLDYNVFTTDRISVTATVALGRTSEPDLQIEYADITREMFPAAHALYAVQPVGRARVRNVASLPRTARVSFYIQDLMDRPTETAPVLLQPGETREIPLYAVFNRAMEQQRTLTIREGEVAAAVSSLDDPDDRYPMRVLLRGRNDWNGDAAMLRYFVTPQDPAVLAYTRQTLAEAKSTLDTLGSEQSSFAQARVLIDRLAGQLQYVHDPKLSQDNVQYPAETLALRGGDCDDLTVTAATLLSSIGIAVAFIDVVPAKHPADGHIYLMFDTGIDATRSSLITANPKRFIVRPNESGAETIWIPLEATAMNHGFAAAWETGANEYYDDVVLHFGLARGWVKIVDLIIPQ